MSKNLHVAIGRRLGLAREKAGMTQGQAAEEFGRSRASVSGWENGKRAPDVAYIAWLCARARISPTWVLLGAGPEALDDEGRIGPQIASAMREIAERIDSGEIDLEGADIRRQSLYRLLPPGQENNADGSTGA